MNAWQKFGLFYAIAAFVFGAVFATMKNVKVEIAGRPVAYPGSWRSSASGCSGGRRWWP